MNREMELIIKGTKIYNHANFIDFLLFFDAIYIFKVKNRIKMHLYFNRIRYVLYAN